MADGELVLERDGAELAAGARRGGALHDKQGRQAFTFESGSGWAIPKGAKNPALACTFIKTMTSTPTWVTAAKKRAAATKAERQAFTGLYTANAVADRKILSTVYVPGSPQ